MNHKQDVNQLEINSTQQLIYRIKFLRLFFALTLKFNEANDKTGEQTYLNSDEISKYLKQTDELLQFIRPSHIIEDETVSEYSNY